jgi:HSP90 family molecular chaperone
MKLDVDANEVILSNVGTTGEFRIKNSQKAFAILSSGLYSNKIRAIIRELSCNAVDSHVAAGKADIPFEVHLPTIFEPWFAVKDFGIGLTGDQVTSIYTTYF